MVIHLIGRFIFMFQKVESGLKFQFVFSFLVERKIKKNCKEFEREKKLIINNGKKELQNTGEH